MLDLNGALGLAGWQWLFLLLGGPPIIFGIVAFFFLNDRPEKASWLSTTEKRLLARMMANEPSHQQTAQLAVANSGWAKALFSRDVLFLVIANLGVFVTLSILTTWTPQIVRALVSGGHFSLFGWIAALPALAAVIAMPLWSRQSDRYRERKWHIVIPSAFAV